MVKSSRVSPGNSDRDASKNLESGITIEALSERNWKKFLDLFGRNGACGSCWCMYYRLARAEFIKGKKNNGNRDALRRIVRSGKAAGLIALFQGEAIGWLAFAPREDFPRLAKSRVHKPIDDKSVWSIPCVFIRKDFRHRGTSTAILKRAAEFAAANHIKIVEAYPAIPTKKSLPDSFLWVGIYESFRRAGFKVVDRKSKSRPMVRFYVNGSNKTDR